jgi:hypothetical protein
MQANVTVAADAAKDDEERVIIQNSATNQFVANKNFIIQNNVWVDTEFAEAAKLAEVNLKFGSDEFFSVLAKEKELANYFSLGDQVVVVWKGKVYRVTK